MHEQRLANLERRFKDLEQRQDQTEIMLAIRNLRQHLDDRLDKNRERIVIMDARIQAVQAQFDIYTVKVQEAIDAAKVDVAAAVAAAVAADDADEDVDIAALAASIAAAMDKLVPPPAPVA